MQNRIDNTLTFSRLLSIRRRKGGGLKSIYYYAFLWKPKTQVEKKKEEVKEKKWTYL